MRGLFVHLPAVCIGKSQYVAGEFDGHALHAQTDAEGGDVVCAPVVGCRQFAFDSSLAESRTDDDAVSIAQLYGDIFVGQLFAVDEFDVGFPIVVSSDCKLWHEIIHQLLNRVAVKVMHFI